MEYKFNKEMVLKPELKDAPNFEEIQNLIKDLVMKSKNYFAQEKELEENLKKSYISADNLNKNITLEGIKELERDWENSLNSFNNVGVKLRVVNPSENLTPETDLLNQVNKANEKIKENVNKSKLGLSESKEATLEQDKKLELEMQKLQKAIESGVDPKLALAEMQAAMQQDNSMKNMPVMGKPGFNVHDRIAATLKNKEAQKGFEITSDILLQKNHDLAAKCESGYYLPELINGSKGNILHLAALNNPQALETLVYQGGADINQIRSDWVVGPETKKEIERLQYEKNNPIKSALGIPAPQR